MRNLYAAASVLLSVLIVVVLFLVMIYFLRLYDSSLGGSLR